MKARRRPKRSHPGQKQISCWIDAALVNRMTLHVRARAGAQLRLEVAAALERYLDAIPASVAAAQGGP